MPGIAGLIKIIGNERVDHALFDKICLPLIHRDWYRVSKFSFSSGSAASISATKSDNSQKILHNDVTKVTIVFEGEIFGDNPYGSRNISYIYDEYIKHGKGFLKDLNGSFVILIADEREKKIIIANDHVGSRPLFWYKDDDSLYFAPEIKAFLKIPSFKASINEAAIASFLSSGFLADGLTYFNDLNKLNNASLIVLSNGKLFVESYWDYSLTDVENKTSTIDKYCQEIKPLIMNAVSRRINDDFNYGLLLSGGIDSRTLLGAYCRVKSSKGLKTITWGKSDTTPQSDAVVAYELSRFSGTDHRFYHLNAERICETIEDGISLMEGATDEIGNYPESVEIFERIREELGVDFIIRGDECFGYGSDFVHSEEDVLGVLGIKKLENSPRMMQIISKDYREGFIESNRETCSKVLAKCHYGNLQNKTDYLYLKERLYSHLNPLSYMKQIEIGILNPYIDREILDFIKTVPSRHRGHKLFFHLASKELFPDLFNIPIATKDNMIDWSDEIRNNKLIQSYIINKLLNEDGMFDKYIDKTALSTFLKEYFSSNQSIDHSSTSLLWNAAKKRIKTISPIVSFARRFKRPWAISNEATVFRLLTLKILFDKFEGWRKEGLVI